jgi:DNA-binding beta-propeller fold protein YncE
VPQLATYGDIAVYRPDAEHMDFFLSGSMKGYPFVLRIRLLSDGTATAKTLISTLTPNIPEETNARGVAVNLNGTVLTTLPSYPNGEFLISFPANFDEAGASAPLVHNAGIASQGMDVDAAGNFYIATGLDDVPLCNLQGGAVVAVSSDLSQYTCSEAGLGTGLTRDLAVTPDGSALYLTAANGTVWQYRWPQ